MIGDGMKIAVAGNATLDAHMRGTAEIKPPSKIVIASGGKIAEVDVLDGPLEPDVKHRIAQGIEEVIDGMDYELLLGGGGYNNIVALREFSNGKANIDLVYLDVSRPHTLITESLRTHSVPCDFFWKRAVPTNIVIGGKERILLKGPNLPRIHLEHKYELRIENIVNSSDAIIVNSAKDEEFVEYTIRAADKSGIPLFFVLSPSLQPDFIFRQMLPRGVSVSNYKEMISIFGHRPGAYDENGKMELALEAIKEIRMDKINPNQDLHVTLDRNGVFCSDTNGIFHVRLADQYLERVQECVLRKKGSSNGTGDVYAAIAVYYTTAIGNGSVADIAKIASAAAIKHLGYKGPLPDSAFRVNKVA